MSILELLSLAWSDLYQRTAAFLPLLITAIVILLVGWVVGWLAAALARRLALRLNIDRAFEGTGLADGLARAEIHQPVSRLISQLIFWVVFLAFLLVALESLGLTVAIVPMQGLLAYLPRVLAAILAVIIGSLLAQFLGRAAQATAAGAGVDTYRGVGRTVYWLILAIALVVAVDQLGLDVSLLTSLLTNLVTLAAAGLALAFALGGRDIVRNALDGYYARELFPLGGAVIIEGEEGVLDAIGPLNAEIIVGEDRLVVPNSWLTEGRVRIRGSQD